MEKVKIDVILPNSEAITVSAYEVPVPDDVFEAGQDPRLYVNKTVIVGDDGEPDYDGTWTVTDEPTGAYYLARFPDRDTAVIVAEKLYELGAQEVQGSRVRDAALQIRQNYNLLDFMEQAHRETFGYGGKPPTAAAIKRFVKAYRPPATPGGVSEGVAARMAGEEAPAPKPKKRKGGKKKPKSRKPATKKSSGKKKTTTKKKGGGKKKDADDAASILLRGRGINPLSPDQHAAKIRCLS